MSDRSSRRVGAGFGAFTILMLVLFVGLGIWQVERLGWKLRLIDAVNTRVHAAAVAAPGPSAWPGLTGYTV